MQSHPTPCAAHRSLGVCVAALLQKSVQSHPTACAALCALQWYRAPNELPALHALHAAFAVRITLLLSAALHSM
jgi:hypothetical protein